MDEMYISYTLYNKFIVFLVNAIKISWWLFILLKGQKILISKQC